MQLPRILVLDDQLPVRECIREQLRAQGYETEEAGNLTEAFGLLQITPFDLVLCDLRMPEATGIEFLRQASSLQPEVGVVMMSGSGDLSVAVETMRLGALDYVSKPFSTEQIVSTVASALDRLRERKERNLYLKRNLKRLEDLLASRGVGVEERQIVDPASASEGTLNALVAALDAREHETEAHSRRVGEYALYLARFMGVRGVALEDVRKGALLHDIGKIGIADRILLKPGRLTSEEWVEMRKHPEIGYWILAGSKELRSASEIVIAHHERWDGAGYPNRLKGTAIPLGARIFSVVDAFDALTSDRPYHQGESYEAARKEIERNAGTQFDPDVVTQFLRVPEDVWMEIRGRTLGEWAKGPADSPNYAATA